MRTWHKNPALPAEEASAPVLEESRGCLMALRARSEDMAPLIVSLAERLLHGQAIYCFDASNQFRPLGLAHRLLHSGADPENILTRLFVTRAFTCHQFVTALQSLPLPEKPPRPGLLVLGVEHLFCSEEIPLWERRFLFGEALRALEAKRRRGFPVIATFGDHPDAARGGWERCLRRVADHCLSVEAIVSGACPLTDLLDQPHPSPLPEHGRGIPPPT